MLKYLPLGAAIAIIASTQIPIEIPVLTIGDRKIQTSQLANPNQPDDNSDVNTLLTAALVGGTAATGVILATKKTNKPSSTGVDQASPKLRKRLMTLLHNDEATASRLIAQIKRNHPHQSTNWAAEKAIYDLERDRGGR